MVYYNDLAYNTEDELMHYGVKGMKWGVRRFQNYDGTYTRLGLARYRKAETDYDRSKARMIKARKAYRSNTGSKQAYKAAKANLRTSKLKLKSSYKKLLRDYDADEGKKLHDKGLTGKKAYAKYAVGMGVAVIGYNVARAILADKIQNGDLNISPLAGGAAGVGAALVNGLVTRWRNQSQQLNEYEQRARRNSSKQGRK